MKSNSSRLVVLNATLKSAETALLDSLEKPVPTSESEIASEFAPISAFWRDWGREYYDPDSRAPKAALEEMAVEGSAIHEAVEFRLGIGPWEREDIRAEYRP